MSTTKNEHNHILSPEWLKKNPLPDDAERRVKGHPQLGWVASDMRMATLFDSQIEKNEYRTQRTDLPPEAYITPPTDTTGIGREGETPETDAAEHGPGRGGFAGHCSADFARKLERQRDAALAQVEALRRDGERWQEYRKYVGEELTRLRNALFSYALPDEDGRHEIAEKALGTEVLRELRRAAIDSAQRQEGR